ncbi:MAG: SAM-dependent methyltransferase [Planctomycetaceae bacterium]
MSEHPDFLFATCQVGAEGALKSEMARTWPDFRFAYSRPGFLTFKLPPGPRPPDDLDLECVFARASGFSLGKAAAATIDEKSQAVWRLLGQRPITHLHVWPRDQDEPGYREYEPGVTPEAVAAGERILQSAPQLSGALDSTTTPMVADSSQRHWDGHRTAPHLNQQAEKAELVGDVVLIDEKEWWVGVHRVRSLESSWPGGFFPEALPSDAVSRVYLKMREALVWSGFDLRPGQRVAEIGCAPGGASQALLERGVGVLGIDPAEVAPLVLGHPRFRHIRKRSKEVRRREFLDIQWLTCDVNLPPNYTLDTVEAIVGYPGVGLHGLLLTLKLVEWSMADEIPEYLERVRRWGFLRVRARQLHHNRREICVAASGPGRTT